MSAKPNTVFDDSIWIRNYVKKNPASSSFTFHVKFNEAKLELMFLKKIIFI